MEPLNKKVGILGGGQLGKMLALAAGNWHLPIFALDTSVDFPAGGLVSHFTEGSFKDFEDVLNFGRTVDVLTIEIEHVNTEALKQLEQEGIVVHPSPRALEIIKDKGLQKQFYATHNIPTSNFQLYPDEHSVKEALENGGLDFPFVQKSRTAGYDGRGVAVIRSAEDLPKLLPGACVIEDLVPIEKELAVIVARNPDGEIAAFPTVEMEFNPVANLVEYLLSPARISDELTQRATSLAKQTIEAYDLCGLLAVELFLDKSGRLMVNEVAPRPHNSGHHTIDSCYTSQYEQHLRAIINLPLGSTRLKCPAVMVNLLGSEGHTGPASYLGVGPCMAKEGVKVHIYGKTLTKPFRKMGHVTVLDSDLDLARNKAEWVKDHLRVVSKSD